ncbi:MAG TPA: hypothetical protein VJV74_06610 [Terriglobia bacterium]|nr:hypothetical protein [Terriglobia bacterium]
MRIKLVGFLSAALLVVSVVPCLPQDAPTQGTLTYTQIPDLCCSGNRANGINSRGDIVGHYFEPSGLRHGYLFESGSAAPAPIDFSTAPFDTPGGTSARGINAQGNIVGDYIDGVGVDHGYLFSNGVFTSIDATSLGAVDTVAHGLNDIGEIVGDYIDSGGKFHAFLLSNGVFQTIDFPLSASTFAQSSGRGIANNGTIVGRYFDASGFQHGFERSPAGVFTSITDSAAAFTFSVGINAERDVVGSYTDVVDRGGEKVVGSHGFLLSAGDLTDFIPVDFPATGVMGTQARGINPSGTIVGAFVDSAGAYHGFVATR